MQTQKIFESDAQARMGFAIPPQVGLEFPQSLAERYCPTLIQDFIGIERPKTFFTSLIKAPRACATLLIGPPGSGKTTLALAFAEQLGGSLKHLPAQKCDVAALEELRDQLAYSPNGGWWIVLIDEVDGMTEKAQLQLLSWLDGTAALKPKFGGGFERGEKPPVIFVMTCNGIGPDETQAPLSLLPRFQSRCMKFEFEAANVSDLAVYLERIWKQEGGQSVADAGYFPYMADGVGVRDALMRLETDLLAGPRRVPKAESSGPVLVTKAAPVHNSPALSPAKKAWVTRRAKLAAAQKGRHG